MGSGLLFWMYCFQSTVWLQNSSEMWQNTAKSHLSFFGSGLLKYSMRRSHLTWQPWISENSQGTQRSQVSWQWKQCWARLHSAMLLFNIKGNECHFFSPNFWQFYLHVISQTKRDRCFWLKTFRGRYFFTPSLSSYLVESCSCPEQCKILSYEIITQIHYSC